jgi:putative phosphoribosyl transferase
MYFASRMQAGRMLASQIVKKYRYENCAVVALDDGGVMIGAQIAIELHCVLMMLLSAEIMLPREPDAVAGITMEGSMTYNHQFYQGELDEMTSEYRSYIDQERLRSMHDLNRLVSDRGVIDKDLLKGHNIIVVSEGFRNGFLLDLAKEFMKTTAILKLIVATPLASVKAVDIMHISADEIYCLNVVEDYISTDHYYDQHDVPDHAKAIEMIEKNILLWQ